MQSQISSSRGESVHSVNEEKKFASKSLDMNKLNKYKKTVANFKKSKINEKDKAAVNEINIVEEETEITKEGEEVKIKSTNLRPKRPHPNPTTMASASSASSQIILRNALRLHERASAEQTRLFEDIEKVNVAFYKNYLARKNQKKILASYEATIDNIVYVAAGAVVLAGAFQIVAIYGVPYMLNSLATTAAQSVSAAIAAPGAAAQTLATKTVIGAVKTKVFDALMSETTVKFASEVFLGLTPIQTNELNQKLGAIRGALTELMKVDSIRKGVLSVPPTFDIMQYAFNGKNPMNMATSLEGTDLLPKNAEAVSVALKPFQEAVLGLRNFMIDRALGPIAGYPLKTDISGLTSAVGKAGNATKLTSAATTLFSSVKADPNSEIALGLIKTLGVKDIGGVSVDSISKLFKISSTVTNIKKAKTDYMNFYRDNKMAFDNVYALFTPPSKTAPAPKTGYFETLVQRAKGSTVLRGAFSNNVMSAFGFATDAAGNYVSEAAAKASRSTPMPAASQSMFSIQSTVLYFKGKITPGNFLGYTSGVVYDSVSNKVSTGIQSFYPSAFAANKKPEEDEEMKDRKQKEEEKYEEGMRKYRITLIGQGEKGAQLKRLMKEAEIMNRPDGVIDPKDFQAVEYAYLNVKLKAKQLMEKGALFEPFLMWGTTASLQLFNETATFHLKPNTTDSMLSFDIYGLAAEPFVSTFQSYYAVTSDSAFSKLANDLNTSIQKIYNDTYENYIRKPLMDSDIIKYINENGRKKLNAATKKFLAKVYLGVYIEKVFTQITDLFFDTLINMPINFPSRVVGDFQMHFYSKYNINQYLTPNGWKFMTDNLGGAKIGAMFNSVIKNVKTSGWTSSSVQQGLVNYMKYNDEELYPGTKIVCTNGWSSFSGMLFGSKQLSAEDLKRHQEAAVAASNYMDFKRRLGESVEKSKEDVAAAEAKIAEIEAKIKAHNATPPDLLSLDYPAWKVESTYLAGQYIAANAVLGKEVTVEYFTETYAWTVDKAEAIQSTLYSYADYARMKALSTTYDAMHGLIGDRGEATSVKLSVGSGLAINLKGREKDAFLWQKRRDEFAIGLASYHLQNPGRDLDQTVVDAYAKKLHDDDIASGKRPPFEMADVNILGEVRNAQGKVVWSPAKNAKDIWNALDAAKTQLTNIGNHAGETITCDANGKCTGIPEVKPLTWMDRITGSSIQTEGAKWHAAAVKAYRHADLLNRSTAVEQKAPTTQFANVNNKLYEIIIDKTKISEDNILGITWKEVKTGETGGKSVTKFETISEMESGIKTEILGEKASSDSLAKGEYIEIKVPNYSLFGPAYYTTKISGEEYEQRRLAEVGALNMLEKSGLDTSTEDYKNSDVYKGLKEQLETNDTFRNNMGIKELQETATLALNLQAQNIIDGWVKDGKPDVERQTAARQAMSKAINTPGLIIDRDLISIYHQRDTAITASHHAYQAAIAALPPGLKAAMKANTEAYLKKTKGQLDESKATITKLIADLEKSNAQPCAIVDSADVQNFRDAYSAIKSEAETVGNTDNYALQSYNDALGSEDGKGGSSCDPKASAGALDVLKTRQRQINEKIEGIERNISNLSTNPDMPANISELTKDLGKITDTNGITNSINRLIEGKSNFNQLFNPESPAENGKSFQENLKNILVRSADALAKNAKNVDIEATATSKSARTMLEQDYKEFNLKNAATNSLKGELAAKLNAAAKPQSYERKEGESEVAYFKRVKALADAANTRREEANALSQNVGALLSGFYSGEEGKARLLIFKPVVIETPVLPSIAPSLISLNGTTMAALNNSINDMKDEITAYSATVGDINRLGAEIKELAPDSEQYVAKAAELAQKIKALDKTLPARAAAFIKDYEKERARLVTILKDRLDTAETLFQKDALSQRAALQSEIDAVQNALIGFNSINLSEADLKTSGLSKERLETMKKELEQQMTNLDISIIRFGNLRSDMENGKMTDILNGLTDAGNFMKEFKEMLSKGKKTVRESAIKEYNAKIEAVFETKFKEAKASLKTNSEARMARDKARAEGSYKTLCKEHCGAGTKAPKDTTDPEVKLLMSSLNDVINASYTDTSPSIDTKNWANSTENLAIIVAAAAEALDPHDATAFARNALLDRAENAATQIKENYNKQVQEESEAIQSFLQRSQSLLDGIGSIYKVDKESTAAYEGLTKRLSDLQAAYNKVDLTSENGIFELKALTIQFDGLLKEIPDTATKIKEAYAEAHRKAKAIQDESDAIQGFIANAESQMGELLKNHPEAATEEEYIALSSRISKLKGDHNTALLNRNIDGLKAATAGFTPLLAELPGKTAKIETAIKDRERTNLIKQIDTVQEELVKNAAAARREADKAKLVLESATKFNSIFNDEDHEGGPLVGSKQAHLNFEAAQTAAAKAELAALTAENLVKANSNKDPNMTLETAKEALVTARSARDAAGAEAATAAKAYNDTNLADGNIRLFYYQFSAGVKEELVKVQAMVTDLTRINELWAIQRTAEETALFDKYFTKGDDGRTGFDKLKGVQELMDQFTQVEPGKRHPPPRTIPPLLRSAGGPLDIILGKLDANRPVSASEKPMFKQWNDLQIAGLLNLQAEKNAEINKLTDTNSEAYKNLLAQQTQLAEALAAAQALANSLKNDQALTQAQVLGIRLAGQRIEEEQQKNDPGKLDIYNAAFNAIGKPAITRFAKYCKKKEGDQNNNYNLDFLNEGDLQMGIAGAVVSGKPSNVVSKERALQKMTVEFAIDDYMDNNESKFKDKDDKYKEDFRKEFRKCFTMSAEGGVSMGGSCSTDPLVSQEYKEKYSKEQLEKTDSQLNIQASYIISQIWKNDNGNMVIDSTTAINSSQSINSMISRLLSENYQPPESLLSASTAYGLMIARKIADSSVYVMGAVATGSAAVLEMGSAMLARGAISSAGNQLLGMTLRSGKIYGGALKAIVGTGQKATISPLGQVFARSISVLGKTGTLIAATAICGVIGGTIGYFLAPKDSKILGATIGAVLGGAVGIALYAAFSLTPAGVAVNSVLFLANLVAGVAFIGSTLIKGAAFFLSKGIGEAEKGALKNFLPNGVKPETATEQDWAAARESVQNTLGNGVRDFMESYTNDPNLATRDLLSTDSGGALRKALESNGVNIFERLKEKYNKSPSEGGLPADIKGLLKPDWEKSSNDKNWYKELSEEDGNKLLNALFPVSSGIKNTAGGGATPSSVKLERGSMPLDMYYDKVLYYIFLSKFPLLFKGYSEDAVYLQTALDFFKFFIPLYKEAETMSLKNIQKIKMELIVCINMTFLEPTEDTLEKSLALPNEISAFEESEGKTPVNWPALEDRDFARYSSGEFYDDSQTSVFNQKTALVAANKFDKLQIAEQVASVPISSEHSGELEAAVAVVSAAEETALVEGTQVNPVPKATNLVFDLDKLHKACDAAIQVERNFDYETVIKALFRRMASKSVYDVCRDVKYPSCERKEAEFEMMSEEYDEAISVYEELTNKTDAALSEYGSKIGKDRVKIFNNLNKKVKELRDTRKADMKNMASGQWVGKFKTDLTKAYQDFNGWLGWGDPEDKLAELVDTIFEENDIEKTLSGGSRKRLTRRKRVFKKR